MNYRTHRYALHGVALMVSLGISVAIASQDVNGPRGTNTTSVAVVYFNHIERLKLPVPSTVARRLTSTFERELQRIQTQLDMLSMGNKLVESFDGFRIEPLVADEARALKSTLADELRQWSLLAGRYLDNQSKVNIENRLATLEKQLLSIAVQ